MRRRGWMFYFISLVVLVIYVFLGNRILSSLSERSSRTFNIMPLMIGTAITYIVGGVLLGIERILIEKQKSGVWAVNWPRIIILGLPSLYFSLGFLLYFSQNTSIRDTLGYPILVLLQGNSNLISFFQIILGYILVTSLIKS